MRFGSPVLVSLLLSSGVASAQSVLAVDSASSSVTYHLVHKLHKFDGTSKKVEGRVRALPTGQVQVMIRVPVESFDSGNVNRDEHMKETVEAARFPTVDVKALIEDCRLPDKFPTTFEKRARAQITLHGTQQSIEVPVQLTFESADRVRVATQFGVSVEGFKIDRPSLMFVKIDDQMKIDAKLAFVKAQ